VNPREDEKRIDATFLLTELYRSSSSEGSKVNVLISISTRNEVRLDSKGAGSIYWRVEFRGVTVLYESSLGG
jgi:hypothetical protein